MLRVISKKFSIKSKNLTNSKLYNLFRLLLSPRKYYKNLKPDDGADALIQYEKVCLKYFVFHHSFNLEYSSNFNPYYSVLPCLLLVTFGLLFQLVLCFPSCALSNYLLGYQPYNEEKNLLSIATTLIYAVATGVKYIFDLLTVTGRTKYTQLFNEIMIHGYREENLKISGKYLRRFQFGIIAACETFLVMVPFFCIIFTLLIGKSGYDYLYDFSSPVHVIFVLIGTICATLSVHILVPSSLYGGLSGVLVAHYLLCRQFYLSEQLDKLKAKKDCDITESSLMRFVSEQGDLCNLVDQCNFCLKSAVYFICIFVTLVGDISFFIRVVYGTTDPFLNVVLTAYFIALGIIMGSYHVACANLVCKAEASANNIKNIATRINLKAQANLKVLAILERLLDKPVGINVGDAYIITRDAALIYFMENACNIMLFTCTWTR